MKNIVAWLRKLKFFKHELTASLTPALTFKTKENKWTQIERDPWVITGVKEQYTGEVREGERKRERERERERENPPPPPLDGLGEEASLTYTIKLFLALRTFGIFPAVEKKMINTKWVLLVGRSEMKLSSRTTAFFQSVVSHVNVPLNYFQKCILCAKSPCDEWRWR